MELLLLLLPQLKGKGCCFLAYTISYIKIQVDYLHENSRFFFYFPPEFSLISIFSFSFQFLHLLLNLLQTIISKTPFPSGCRLLHA